MSAAGKRVAILVEEGFEDSELIGPLEGLRDAGVTVTIIGPAAGREYSGKRGEVVTSDQSAGAHARGQVAHFDLEKHWPADKIRDGINFYLKPQPIVVLAASEALTDFDAVIIPGGYAPDRMRMRHAMVDLARDTFDAGKPVAAICHGPQLLISADVLRGRTVTCWPSIAVDVRNAGGLYVDRPVVQDGNLITSRKPDDVPVFTATILKALEG